jgi:hypothetical protein
MDLITNPKQKLLGVVGGQKKKFFEPVEDSGGLMVVWKRRPTLSALKDPAPSLRFHPFLITLLESSYYSGRFDTASVKNGSRFRVVQIRVMFQLPKSALSSVFLSSRPVPPVDTVYRQFDKTSFCNPTLIYGNWRLATTVHGCRAGPNRTGRNQEPSEEMRSWCVCDMSNGKRGKEKDSGRLCLGDEVVLYTLEHAVPCLQSVTP